MTPEEYLAELNAPLFVRTQGRVSRRVIEDEMAQFNSARQALGA